MTSITLPWPDRRLSPNSRGDYHAKFAPRQAARQSGYFAAAGAEIERAAAYTARIVFCPPDRRKRDLDNLYAACKAYQDGICDALAINDSQIARVVLEWGAVRRPGQVVITIEGLEDE